MEHTLAAGDGISHYRIVGALGSGGMGEVYLAQDLTLDRSVALKVLPPRLVRNEERLRRFVVEAKAASSLNHPGIVTIYEIGSSAIERDGEEQDPVHFIAMERIDGRTLADLIHADKEDLRRLLGYLAQAADGIAKAHGSGIVHRDLKPSNIMVSRDGFAKVLDFGLAKLTETRPPDDQVTVAPTRTGTRTGAGTVMGTVGYMSPEQVQGKSVDHRSDIFSFGCVLYEAVTRRRAFEADSAVDTMHKILHDAPIEPHELNPRAPADLRRLVRRCLAKSPDQRLQSMKDLAIELREIADNYESLSSSASSASSGSSASGASAALGAARRARSRAWWAGGAIVAVLAIAGLAIGLGGGILRQRESSPAEASPATGLSVTSIPGREGVAGVAISGDGRYLALPVQSSESTSIWVRQLATGSEVQVVPPRKARFLYPSFSPDGDYIYYLVVDPGTPTLTTLERVPTLGGPTRKLVSDVGYGFSLTQDGRGVGFVRTRGKSGESAAIVRDLEQGHEKVLATLSAPLEFYCAPALSPDGRTFVTAIHTAEKGIHGQFVAIDATSLAQTPFGATGWEPTGPRWLPDGSGFIVNAWKHGEGETDQLFLVSYPEGRHRKIASDPSAYVDFHLTADGRRIAALRLSKLSNVWSVPLERNPRPRQLTFNASGANAVGSFVLAADGTIAFSAASGHNTHVWTLRPNDQTPRQITPGANMEWVIRALPSGEFVTGRMGPDFVWRTVIVSPDGGNSRTVVPGSGEVPEDVSPDGKTLLFARVDSPRTLWAVDMAGGEPRRVADDFNYSASVSPDGRRVAYLAVPEVEGTSPTTCVVVPIGGGAPLATFTWPTQSSTPKWTPDGQGISFVVSNETVTNLFVQPLAGGPPRPLTRLTKGRISAYLWTPDGKRVVLKRQLGNVSNLWSAGVDGRAPEPITDFPTGEIFGIEISGDGKTLYFLYGSQSSDIVLLDNFR